MSYLKRILLLFLLLAFQIANAQKLYFSIGGGPSFGMAKEPYSNFYDIDVVNTSTELETANLISFGKGFNSRFRLAYRLTENLDIAIEASYLQGGKNSYSQSRLVDNNNEFRLSERRVDVFGNMWSISPNLVFSPFNTRISPYIRIGPSLNFGRTYEEVEYKYLTTTISTEEFTGPVSWGFLADLGVKYLADENWEIFAEIRFHSFSFEPTESQITQYEIDGVDQLASLNTYKRKTVYKDKISEEQGTFGFVGIERPFQELSISQPFSSVQFLIGISYNL